MGGIDGATGGCDCKAVRYELLARPLIVHCCHCRWCQRETGSAFALNALIEADKVAVHGADPASIATPSESGAGQIIARCPVCQVALWSNYAGAGPLVRFIRVGTLDDPDLFPPGIHIHVSSKQPWVILPADVPAVPAYYERERYWSAESMRRWRALGPRIEAYRAAMKRAGGP